MGGGRKTFIGNVIFVCLQLPSALICLSEAVAHSPKDCSSERLRFITNGKAFIADGCTEIRKPPHPPTPALWEGGRVDVKRPGLATSMT